ncbi:acetate--CoA ligase family protein [Neoroseomonas terrae]|jgi:acyl-CoA synthetase (NDP forming)|uniref:acetate--CoA ligase family protein n=1 Tax=Neoroseomonas terrae TaxID=424799 RepID=UPI001BA67F89|nr:acetate--CoA ligase family protein [Neoroseomonas terrae]
MLDIAYVCSIGPRPPSSGVGILSVSGGIGVLMADACIEAGLDVPPMPPEALTRIRDIHPVAGGRNPIDTTAQLGGRMHIFEGVSQAMMRSADLGSMVFYLAHLGRNAARFPPLEHSLTELRRVFPDRLVVAVMTHVDEIRLPLERAGIPVFEDPSRAIRAIRGAAQIRILQADADAPPDFAPGPPLNLSISNEAEAKARLAQAGVPVLRERVCATAEEAIAAATELGYPVALKILSEDIAHKTEVGGVLLNLGDGRAVAHGFSEVMGRARERMPAARLDGVLIAPMVKGGVETIVGVQRDPVFGPMVMFGLGGVSVELFQDVAFASAPLTTKRAEVLVRDVRAARLLDHWRGRPPMDARSLVEALCRISEFGARHQDEIASIEVNPLLVFEDGVVALDALIHVRGRQRC